MPTYQPGDMPVPDYKVEKFLGEGGYGRVYKVVNNRGIAKALKVITLRDTQGFKEYKALALFKEIRHTFLVPIENYWLKDEHGREIRFSEDESLNIAGRGELELLILMGLGDRSLQDRLKECIDQSGTGIPRNELMEYMEYIAKAIDFLNSPKTINKQLIDAINHGDIKPGNVLMVGDGVQVADYGLAQAISVRPDAGKSRTTTGGAEGTPEYAAPEQFGKQPTKYSDQYSLAISYYEMRTGRLPFDDSFNRWACLVDKFDFSLLPYEEQEVLHKATTRQFAQRYPSCIEFVRALRKAQHSREDIIEVREDMQINRPSRRLLDLLQPGAENFLPGYQIIDPLGNDAEEQLWKVYDKQKKEHALLKIINGSNPSHAFDEYLLLSKLHGIQHKNILNIQWLKVVDHFGNEVPSEQINQAHVLSDKLVIVLIELAERTLEDYGTELRNVPNSGRLTHRRYDIIKYLREGSDYWLNFCEQGFCVLNPAYILLDKHNEVKIDSARIAKFLHKTPSQLADSFSFSAPELFEGKHTKKSDQYSLAMIYYWLCTGGPVFPLDYRPADIVNYFQTNTLDYTSHLHDEAAVLGTATRFDPEQRHADSIEFIDALRTSLKFTDYTQLKPGGLAEYHAQKVHEQQEAEAAKAAKVSGAVGTVTPGGPVSNRPSGKSKKGQTVRLEDLGSQEYTAVTGERITEKDGPRTTPWNAKKTGKSGKETQKVPTKVTENTTQGLLGGIDDDDEKLAGSKRWAVVAGGLLVVALIAGLVWALPRFIGPTETDMQSKNIPTVIPTPSASIGSGDGGGGTKDPVLTNAGTTLTPNLAELWKKDYPEILEKLKNITDLTKLGIAAKAEGVRVSKEYAKYTEAIATMKTITEYVSLLADAAQHGGKKVDQLSIWLKSYQKAEKELAAEYSDAITSLERHRQMARTNLIAATEKLFDQDVEDEPAFWKTHEDYLKAIQQVGGNTAKAKLMLAECALMQPGNKTRLKIEYGNDSYSNYLEAKRLATITTGDIEYPKVIGHLTKVITDKDASILLKSGTRFTSVDNMVDAAIKSYRLDPTELASFKENTNEEAVRALILKYTLLPDNKDKNTTQLRLIAEIATTLSAIDDSCIAWYTTKEPSLKKIITSLDRKQQSDFIVKQCKAYAKYQTKVNDTYKIESLSAALSMLCDSNANDIEISDIYNFILKPSIVLSEREAASANVKREDFGKQLFTYHEQVMLNNLAKWFRYSKEREVTLCALLLEVSMACSKFDTGNSLANVYSIIHRLNDIDPRWHHTHTEYDAEHNAWESMIMKYAEASMVGKVAVLCRHLQSRLHLTQARAYSFKSDKKDRRNELLKKATDLTKNDMANLFTSPLYNDYDKFILAESRAYLLNQQANFMHETRESNYEAAVKLCDEIIDKMSSKVAPDHLFHVIHTKAISQEDIGLYLRKPEGFVAALNTYNTAFTQSKLTSSPKALDDQLTLDLARCNYRYFKLLSKKAKPTQDDRKTLKDRSGEAKRLFGNIAKDKDCSNYIKVESYYFKSMLNDELVRALIKDKNYQDAISIFIDDLADLRRSVELTDKINGYYKSSIVKQYSSMCCLFLNEMCNPRFPNFLLKPSHANYQIASKALETVLAHAIFITGNQSLVSDFSDSVSLLKATLLHYAVESKDIPSLLPESKRTEISTFYRLAIGSEFLDLQENAAWDYFYFAADVYDAITSGAGVSAEDRLQIGAFLLRAAEDCIAMYATMGGQDRKENFIIAYDEIFSQISSLYKKKLTNEAKILAYDANLSFAIHFTDLYLSSNSDIKSKEFLRMDGIKKRLLDARELAKDQSVDSQIRKHVAETLEKHDRIVNDFMRKAPTEVQKATAVEFLSPK